MLNRTVHFLAGLFFLLTGHLASAQTPKLFALDALLNWEEPFAIGEKDMVVPFEGMGVTGYKRFYTKMKSGEDCRIFDMNSDAKCQLHLLPSRFPVKLFRAHYSYEGQLYKLEMTLLSAGVREALEVELDKLLGARSTMGKMVNKGQESPIWRWDSPKLILISHAAGPELLRLEILNPNFPTESSFPIRKSVTLIAPQTVAAPVDLDALLDFDKVWTYSPDDLEKVYRVRIPDQKEGAQFEWLGAEKTRARFSRKVNPGSITSLTLLAKQMEAQEAIVEFVGGRLARVTITLYNRRDSGAIEPSKFREKFIKAGQHLKQRLAMAPKNTSAAAGADRKVARWLWESPQCLALIEHNDYEGEAAQVPELLQLKLAPPRPTE
ncbi:hypothetical protein GCM10023213_16480 [Prosthecobacter algae]|uniref:DUF3108 domain-containing protein n=1 Tax=Prosthecobacter algae TaxID=1144682 RepID=A0ABP9P092_9BACT